MSVLLGALCALSLVLGSPPASADSRVVPDRAGERRDGFTVDSARFTVSRSHVRVTARYSPQMSRSELAFIQLDMRPRGNGTRGVYTASYNAYGRGDGRRWTLARRGVAGDIRCGWERRVDFRRDLVRMSLPAACFGRDRGFRSMDFSYTSYCEHDGIHNDRIRTRRPVRRG